MMKLPKDLLSGVYIAPDVFLCQTDKTVISKINVLNLNGTFKWAQYSELSFTIPRTYTDEVSQEERVHPAYNFVDGLRLVYLDGFGYFQIQEPTLTTDGIREVKEVTAFSSEYALSQKYLETFVINKGVLDNAASIDGVQLYDANNPSHSLLNLILDEKAPDWKIGRVDPELATEQRSFEVDRQSIYDFLTNDLQDAFKCVVLFDTIENTVNIYKEEEDEHYQTDVYVTFDNLAKNINVSYSADDIKTVLTVTGDEDLDIRNVNLGLPYIMDLSYYHTVEWMGQDLYDAYSAYLDKLNNARETFKTLSSQIRADRKTLEELNGKTADTLTDDMMDQFWEFLADFYNYYDDTLKTKHAYVPDQELLSDLTDAFINLYNIYTKTTDTEIVSGKTYYTYDAIRNIYEVVATPDAAYLSTYYEKDSTKENQWKATWNSFVSTISGSASYADKDAAVADILRTNSSDTPTIFGLLGLDLLKHYQYAYKEAQVADVTGGISKKDGWPTTANDEYYLYYAVVQLLNAVNAEIALREADIATTQEHLDTLLEQRIALGNSLSIHENFTDTQLARLSPFLREDEYSNDDYVTTDLDTYEDELATEEELLQDGMTELHKISQPKLQIEENIFNLLALEEFAPIQHQFELGNFIMTEIRPDYIKKSRLLEVTINFDQLSEISVVFGDLINIKDTASTHADLLSQAISVGKQVASNAGHWTNGTNVATEMQKKLNQGLLDAATTLKSIDGTQNVTIDHYGIHLSTIDSGGDLSPNQGWIVNNQMAYTDDNWLTTKSVFGKFTYDGQEHWGVLADAVIAGYIEGTTIKGSTIEGTEIIGATGTFNGDVTIKKRLEDSPRYASEDCNGYGVLSFKSTPFYWGTDSGKRGEQVGLVIEGKYDNGIEYEKYSINQLMGETIVSSGDYYHTSWINEQYVPTTDTQIDASKTYYEIVGATGGKYIYQPVASPVAENLDNYYEKLAYPGRRRLVMTEHGITLRVEDDIKSTGLNYKGIGCDVFVSKDGVTISKFDRFTASYILDIQVGTVSSDDPLSIDTHYTLVNLFHSGINVDCGATLHLSNRAYFSGINTTASIVPDSDATVALGTSTYGWSNVFIGHTSSSGQANGIRCAYGGTGYWIAGMNASNRFTFGNSSYIAYYQSAARNATNTGQSFRITNGSCENSSGVLYEYSDEKHVYLYGGTDSNTTSPYYIGSACIYARVYNTSANVLVGSTGVLGRAASSSQRYKHDIKYLSNLQNATAKKELRIQTNKHYAKTHADMMSVLNIPVVKFKYNDGYLADDCTQEVTGFIAEDIEAVCPECATYTWDEDENGTRIPESKKIESWDERKLIPRMLYVIQEQQKAIQELQQQISSLERR